MDIKIIYEDNDVLVIDKPAGVVVFDEKKNPSAGASTELSRMSLGQTLIDMLLELYPKLAGVGDPPRYGVVHRLDKDTSGILLVAKNNESLIFLQKQFSAAAKALADRKNRENLEKTIEKRYIALATGVIKEDKGTIEALIGRSPADPKKQKVYLPEDLNSKGKRTSITRYRVLERFKEYTLLGVEIKTGRKHQIRCHLSYIHHPIAGDKMYGFKDSPVPQGLQRQFLHASYMKIRIPNGEVKEFKSELPEELKKVIHSLK